MTDLVTKIELYNQANELYHNVGTTIMSDAEFDILKQELLAAGHITDNRVGAPVLVGHVTQAHSQPMLSLANVFTHIGLTSWLKSVGDCYIQLDDKLDGMACALIYTQGRLTQALTRGDGIYGESILANVWALPSVPTELPEPIDIEIRGEITIDKISFQQTNLRLAALNKPLLKSARNTTVGAMKAKDPQVAVDRGCQFIAYSWYGLNYDTHSAGMNYLKTIGFNTVTASPLYHSYQVDEIIQYAQHRLTEISPIDIDGIVLKVDLLSLRDSLGANNTTPHWAVAYKENNEIADTTLEDVVWQVGRTGSITPVGHLTPIDLSGATIDRVTLHNFDEIQRLGVAIGDTVRIVRSGQIIPKVTSVVNASPNRVAITKPEQCPVCSRAVAISAEVRTRCNYLFPDTDPVCDGVAIARLIYACSKEALELKGIGPEVITDLYQKGHIRHIWDLYTPDMAQHLALRHELTAPVRLPQFKAIIATARYTDLYRAIVALGIPSIGRTVSKHLATRIHTLSDLLYMSTDALELKGVIAATFERYIQHPYIQQSIRELDKLIEYVVPPKVDEYLKDQSFVVTGSFDSTMTRKDIEAYIVANGGRLQSSVSNKTTALIVGSDAGSKLLKAKKLGVPTWTRDELLTYIGSLVNK